MNKLSVFGERKTLIIKVFSLMTFYLDVIGT